MEKKPAGSLEKIEEVETEAQKQPLNLVLDSNVASSSANYDSKNGS